MAKKYADADKPCQFQTATVCHIQVVTLLKYCMEDYRAQFKDFINYEISEYNSPKNSGSNFVPPLHVLYKFYEQFMCVFETKFLDSEISFSVEVQFYENPSQVFVDKVYSEIDAILLENFFEKEGNIFMRKSQVSPLLLETCYKSFVLESQDIFRGFICTKKFSAEILTFVYDEFSPIILKICSLNYPIRNCIEHLFFKENFENKASDLEVIDLEYELYQKKCDGTKIPIKAKTKRGLFSKIFVFHKRLIHAFGVFWKK